MACSAYAVNRPCTNCSLVSGGGKYKRFDPKQLKFKEFNFRLKEIE
jgi:hypothetical protein